MPHASQAVDRVERAEAEPAEQSVQALAPEVSEYVPAELNVD